MWKFIFRILSLAIGNWVLSVISCFPYNLGSFGVPYLKRYQNKMVFKVFNYTTRNSNIIIKTNVKKKPEKFHPLKNFFFSLFEIYHLCYLQISLWNNIELRSKTLMQSIHMVTLQISHIQLKLYDWLLKLNNLFF